MKHQRRKEMAEAVKFKVQEIRWLDTLQALDHHHHLWMK